MDPKLQSLQLGMLLATLAHEAGGQLEIKLTILHSDHVEISGRNVCVDRTVPAVYCLNNLTPSNDNSEVTNS